MQKVWRTKSKENHNGVFMWEIMEWMGEQEPDESARRHLIRCLDGTYIVPFCLHFFTEESAQAVWNEPPMEYLNQAIIRIGE